MPEVDLVVVMTVNPGFGHQHFLYRTLPKIARIRRAVEHTNPLCEVEVDGGIDEATAPLAAAAGASVFVAGSSIFGDSAGVPEAMDRLRAAIAQRQSAAVTS